MSQNHPTGSFGPFRNVAGPPLGVRRDVWPRRDHRCGVGDTKGARPMIQRIRAREDWSDKNFAQKGFTLVELLVVISILGILAAVVVFSVSGITDKGQTSACKTDSSEIRTAIAAYQAKNNATDQPTMAQLVSGGFLQANSTLYTITWPSGAPTLITTANNTTVAG